MFVSAFRRRLVTTALVALAGFGAWGSAQAANTYYVRVDGGSAAQCTGRADAPYPGSGSNQACAWKSPHVALPSAGVPRIAGGDTLIIGPGQYMIGWGATGAAGGRCYGDAPYDCYLAPVPSGPSWTARTRILGKSAAGKCTAAPQLWGTQRVAKVLNLEGSSNVEVGCLEITDHSNCVESHVNPKIACHRESAPYGAWASVGVSASASKTAWLHDLNIHGLANRGIMAGGLTNWTVDRTKIVANGWGGWDGDIGTGSSNSGYIKLRGVEVAWNGCGQVWTTGGIHSCWAQQEGGYGDGLGTGKTGGAWLVEDSYFHHNTSDGLDLLYLNGAASTSVTIRRTMANGNAGNQLKTMGNATIENSVVVGNCAYFNGRYNMSMGDQCRAEGNALSVGLAPGTTANIRHNTVTGQGDCLILTSGGDASSKVFIQNNALIGKLDFLANANGNVGEMSCGHYADNSTAPVSYTGNLFYAVKSNQCPAGGGNLCNVAPKLANLQLTTFDATPLVGSPLIDKAPVLATVPQDFVLAPRPSGTRSDIGAYEAQ